MAQVREHKSRQRQDYITVGLLALGSRLFYITLALVSNWLVCDYDSSHIGLARPGKQTPRYLIALERWDSMYFLDIARNGYTFEQAYAFLPMMPLATRALQPIVEIVTGSFLGSEDMWTLSGLLVANMCFIGATVALYELTFTIYKSRTLSLASAISYVAGPAGVFLAAPYTEPVFCFFTFTGLLLFHRKQYIFASIAMGLGSLTRANGVMNAGFFIYYALKVTIRGQKNWYLLIIWLRCVLCSILVALPFLSFQYYAYETLCHETERSWCRISPPCVYSFVQDKYWNVGFMRYWEMKQIPNFLFALLTIALTVSGIGAYAVFLLRGTPKARIFSKALSSPATPYLCLWTLQLFMGLTMMHVNIITRFMTATTPFFWYAGMRLIPDIPNGKLRKGWLRAFALYAIVGTVLYSNFFPPA